MIPKIEVILFPELKTAGFLFSILRLEDSVIVYYNEKSYLMFDKLMYVFFIAL